MSGSRDGTAGGGRSPPGQPGFPMSRSELLPYPAPSISVSRS